ncbi:MAG: hypothetical protein GPJ54_02355 [Candidatus Heimdallarchaeota archaeon]|nr:hypothetical protein [Candidatus Heimdallarchaeota archaeon]
MSENSPHQRPHATKMMSSALAELCAAMFLVFGISFLGVYVILFHLV